jgi:signal transduction histidine kinase
MGSFSIEFLAKLLAIFAVYFFTARIGLSLDAVSGFATLVWPPTGIALAALLILGYRYWPAIAAGAFLVNIVTGASRFVALGIAAGNTLEALAGAYLLTRLFDFHISLERVKDVLALIWYGAMVSTLISATIGVSVITLGGAAKVSFGETWLAWWIGDMLGNLVVAPLILVWVARFRQPISRKQFTEAVMPIALLIVASVLTFYGLPRFGIRPFTFAYAIVPFLIWISLRFRQRGCVTATFVVSTIAIWGTVVTTPHEPSALSHNLILLQCFIGITAATFMVMAAVVAERELTQKKEPELAQKAVMLTKQRLRLETLNKAKDEFISIASHQLRTPATIVKQYLGMLLDAYVGTLPKQQRAYVKAAYDNNERQLKIINDLLRVARLDANKNNLDKSLCDITKLVYEIIAHNKRSFAKRQQQLLMQTGRRHIRAHADEEFLRMVIENLIDNAGKYTGEGGTISIALAQSDDRILLHVSDTGMGIAKKDQARLFQKFSRIENAQSRSINGSGLGLYWAKKVVDLHGGTLTLASEMGKGSTFTMSLPLGPSSRLAKR